MQKYKFHRIEPDKGIDRIEEVSLERWCWEAVYTDGSTLKQFDDDGIFHQFKEIELDKLHVFRMVNYSTGNYYDLYLPEEAKLIHFTQNGRQVIWEDEQKTRGRYYHYRNYCFGYEQSIGGRNFKVINIILPDDRVIITDDPQFVVPFA